MNFYVVMGPDGVVGCTTIKGTAVKLAKTEGQPGTQVHKITLAHKPKEVIRRLLAQSGGYAKDQEIVFEIPLEG